MWYKIKTALSIVAVAAIGIGLVTCSTTARQWSPEHQAQATLMLWTPVPTWTPSTAVIEARTQARVAREHSVRALLIACVIVGLASAVALAIIALSVSARHVKASVQLEPTRAHKRVVVQLPGGVFYDARAGSVDVIAESQPADIARITANAQADAEPVRAVLGAMPERLKLPDSTKTVEGDAHDRT